MKPNRFPAIKNKPLEVKVTDLPAFDNALKGRRSSHMPPSFPGRKAMFVSPSNGSLRQSQSPTERTSAGRVSTRKATSGLTNHQKRIIEIHAQLERSNRKNAWPSEAQSPSEL